MGTDAKWIRTAIAATALLCPAGAHAAFPAGNLIQNGDAEAGPANPGNCDVATQRPSWAPGAGTLGICRYSAVNPADFMAPTATGGERWFAFAETQPELSASQVLDVAVAAPEIDAGVAQANLAGEFGGWGGQDDSSSLRATFRSAGGGVLGSTEIGNVKGAERGYQTRLVPKSGAAQIPAGTRTILAELMAHRPGAGASSNDGYADNLSLTLSQYVPPPSAPPTITTPPAAPSTPAPARTTPRPPATSARGATPPAFGPSGVITGLPSAKRCVSRRAFKIRIRKRRGRTYSSAQVFLNRRQVVTRRGARVTADIDLRGLPKGRFAVRIVVVTTAGEVITGTRRYRTCAKKRRGGRPGPL